MNIRNLSGYIDYSPLKMDATEAEICQYCREAIHYSFCSIVVFPHYIGLAKEMTRNSNVKVVTVAGFPFGNELTAIKCQQAEKYLDLGADEIDMVMNISAFKSRNTSCVEKDIDAVLKQVKRKDSILKVIIEIELLSDQEIFQACNIVAGVGADYVKTSVGLLKSSKVLDAGKVRLMAEAVAKTGTKVKASGGIHSTGKAIEMIEAGASRIGTSKGIEIVTGSTGS